MLGFVELVYKSLMLLLVVFAAGTGTTSFGSTELHTHTLTYTRTLSKSAIDFPIEYYYIPFLGSSSFPPFVRPVAFSSEVKTPPWCEFSEILLAASRCQLKLRFFPSASHPLDSCFPSWQKIFTAIFLLPLAGLAESDDHRKNRTSTTCLFVGRRADSWLDFSNPTGWAPFECFTSLPETFHLQKCHRTFPTCKSLFLLSSELGFLFFRKKLIHTLFHFFLPASVRAAWESSATSTRQPLFFRFTLSRRARSDTGEQKKNMGEIFFTTEKLTHHKPFPLFSVPKSH